MNKKYNRKQGLTLIEMLIALMVSSIILLTILKLTTSSFTYSIQSIKDNHGLYTELQAILDYETAILNDTAPSHNLKLIIKNQNTHTTYKSNYKFTGVLIK